MSTVAIIQARMGSERLPGKVARPLLGIPMLVWIGKRVLKAKYVDDLIIATTEESRDDLVASITREQGWTVYRGSEADVLDRYYQAANLVGAEHIVRITGDCPLVDAGIIDHVVAAYHSTYPKLDYASNALKRSYPHGLDVEVFSKSALERAWREDHNASWREHVTPYLYRHPEVFRLLDVVNPTNYAHYRVTVDTPQDFELINRIYDYFGHGDFGWHEVIDLLTAHPDWTSINKDVKQKTLK